MWLEFARVWRQRARRTGDLAEIEKAVSAAQTALRVWPADDDPGQAAVRHTLGNALQDRYLATGGLAHLDEALESFSAAVARMPETADADSRASQFDSLANALRDRWARTGNKADLDSAIETRRKLLEIATGRDPGHSLLLANLGTNLRERFLLTAHAPDIDESIARYETALQEAGQDPGARSTCTTGLAAALRTRFDFRHQRADIERAITLCESLLDERGPGVPDRDSCKANLANALWDRSRTFGTADDARRATELYLEVLSSSPLRPELAVLTARNLITAGAQLQAWADVATGALAGLAAMDRLVQTQYTREHKEAWLRDARDLSSSAAFALARTGRLEEALVALETGRARLLSETFETGRTGHAPSAEEIIQAAAGAPIVYITDTNEGGLALIVSGPQRPLRVVWLPALTRDEVADRTIRYLQLFLSDSLGAEPVVLDNLGQWLWEAMMGPILAELPAPPEMVLPAPREIVLIPAGSLATLPLHAAWRPGDGPAGGRIHVIDECAVTYAANARARQTASNRAALLSTASLLVVEDPRPTSAGRLEHTGPEADAALAARPGLRLRHEQATKARVRPELRNHSVLHLACHGSVNLYAPLQSRLILAHDEPLTLGELMDDRLPQVRLAVLSACETAVAGRELMDEVVNFPAGMLQAGAAACIGSLWKVSDASTALLMRRFYELWRGTTGPSAALQRAQQWLRDISNEELIASGYAPAPPADDRSQLEQDFWLKARPYYHPFYWAAFAFYGA
jgi:CHAT domain-containing protein